MKEYEGIHHVYITRLRKYRLSFSVLMISIFFIIPEMSAISYNGPPSLVFILQLVRSKSVIHSNTFFFF